MVKKKLNHRLSQQRANVIDVPLRSCHSEPCCSSQTSPSTGLTLSPVFSSCLTSEEGRDLKTSDKPAAWTRNLPNEI